MKVVTANFVDPDFRELDLKRVWVECVAYAVEILADLDISGISPRIVTPLHHLAGIAH